MLNRVLRSVLLIALTTLSACGGGSGSSGSNGGGVGTGSVPAAPTGVTAVAGDTQVALSWTAVSGATGYFASRSTNAGGPYTRLSNTTTPSFTNTGLTNGTTYYYVITAFNTAGAGAQSSEVSVTLRPSGPAGLIATQGNGRVTLSWDEASGASSYNIKRSLTAGGPYMALANTTDSFFVDWSVANSTTFFYVVTTNMLGVESANSTEVSATPVVPATGAAATIDFAATLQTIRGFGGSTAWITDLNAHPGMADRLFGNSGSQQIGLTILRSRIDPSPDPGNHANWATERSNAQLASARGARVIASPWSPPASMKSNGSVNNGGTLNPSRYADYASYLQSFVDYLQAGGVSLYAISLQNEPDWTPTYESCNWTGAQFQTWLAKHGSVLTTRIIMPEAVNLFSLASLADPVLNDAAASSVVDIVGTHLYGTPPAPYANAANKNKEVWMTEHTVETTGMQGAMDLAREIHESLTVGNYNAYIYWWLQNWIVGNSSPYRAGLINDPALDLDLTKKGYVLGQFSKFVRPDFVRTQATANPSSGIYVSAYKDIANDRVVIVAINTGKSDVIQPFTVGSLTFSQFTPHRTSAFEDLDVLPPVEAVGGEFSHVLVANSVTTFVN